MRIKPRGGPTQRDIAERCGVDVSTVNKILRKAPGPAFAKETVRRVLRAAEELGYDRRRLMHAHRRRHARRTGSLRVGVVIYDSGVRSDQGEGVLVEISQSGARLDQVRLPKRTLPLDGFSIGFTFSAKQTVCFADDRPPAKQTVCFAGDGGELKGRLSRVVRQGRGHSLGIEFEVEPTEEFLDGLPGFQ